MDEEFTTIKVTKKSLEKLLRIQGWRNYKDPKKKKQSEVIEEIFDEELERIDKERN